MTNPGRGNRRILLTIAGIPLLALLAASLLWYLVASERLDLVAVLGTANRGELLEQPLQLRTLELADAGGVAFDPAVGKPLWRIVVRGRENCGEDCRELLHYTRQIHKAMGKYQNRIGRVFAVSGQPGEPSITALEEDYPALKVLYTSTARMAALAAGDPVSAAATKDAPAAYYLVDPEGWIILSYAAGADGKDIMADLKFLLKNSSG